MPGCHATCALRQNTGSLGLCAGASDGPPHQHPPGGCLRSGCPGTHAAFRAGRLRGSQQTHGLPEALGEALQLGIGLGLPSRALFEVLRQQTRQQPHAFPHGIVGKAEADEPGEYEEEFGVAVLTHAQERRDHVLSRSHLPHEIRERSQHGPAPHVSGTHLPTLLPVRKPRHEAHIVAQVRVNLLEALADLSKVTSHALKRFDDVSRQRVRGGRAGGTATGRPCGLFAVLELQDR
mmetsp:Transcript_82672/g.267605  ORF Transcript_82672/g.267605 Transcript_82672/m.267605 type:complete len:235 (-) Transcript_82672:533-1237(-)